MLDDGEDIRAGDGWKRGSKQYTLTERVRGQIASMRAEALTQGASYFEPFFRDIETLCDMAEEQELQDRIDKANFKAGD